MSMWCAQTDGEAKYWLKPEIELVKNHGLSCLRPKEIEGIIEVHYEEFAGTWEERFR
jgi:hypothetical protein